MDGVVDQGRSLDVELGMQECEAGALHERRQQTFRKRIDQCAGDHPVPDRHVVAIGGVGE